MGYEILASKYQHGVTSYRIRTDDGAVKWVAEENLIEAEEMDVDEQELTPADCEPDCPLCGETSYFLGALGNTYHFRCRACGWNHNVTESA